MMRACVRVQGTDMKMHAAFMETWRLRAPGMPLIAECRNMHAPYPQQRVSTTLLVGDDCLPEDLVAESLAMETASALSAIRARATFEFEAHDILGGTDSEILLVMLLKCADLSHTVLPTPLHLAWSARLEEEVRLDLLMAAACSSKRRPMSQCGADIKTMLTLC